MRLFEIKTHDLLYNKSLDQQEGTYPYTLEALNKGYCVRSGVFPLQKNVTPSQITLLKLKWTCSKILLGSPENELQKFL